MARLVKNNVASHQRLLQQLKEQLDDLSTRCQELDNSVKQTENNCFVFEVHLFPKRCLSLAGYIEQITNTYHSLNKAAGNNMNETVFKIECERYIGQFQVLLNLVQRLEQGDAKLLYKSYSSVKENLFQKLQKQYQYEHRLLNMIGEQEELYIKSEQDAQPYIKEKIAALKIRYQKCNTFTQKLEFQMEEIQDE